MEAAAGAGKLTSGIDAVWKDVTNKNGRLLIVEKNYMSPARYSIPEDALYVGPPEAENRFFIKDAVDDIIEKVLENGGDVEFVDEGILTKHAGIALIGYY
jgi:hypothetical protein